MFLKTFLIISLFSVALSLRCYDCDPTDGTCDDPVNKNSRDIVCGSRDLKSALDVIQKTSTATAESYANSNYDCVVLQFESYNTAASPSGIYRGCVPKGVKCNYILQDESLGKVTACHHCSNDKCNVGSPNGSTSMTVSLFGIVTSCLAIIIVSGFQ